MKSGNKDCYADCLAYCRNTSRLLGLQSSGMWLRVAWYKIPVVVKRSIFHPQGELHHITRRKLYFFVQLHVKPNLALHVPYATQCSSWKALLFIQILLRSLITRCRKAYDFHLRQPWSGARWTSFCFCVCMHGAILMTPFACNFVTICNCVGKQPQFWEIPK
jgi:hypothetical protein